MTSSAYTVYYHVSDVSAIEGALKQQGLTTYVVDKKRHPRAFKATSFKFVAKCDLNTLQNKLEDADLIWKPSIENDKSGFVEVLGPQRDSVVYVDALDGINDQDFAEELFEGFSGGWAAHLLEALQDSGLLPEFFPELSDTVHLDGGPYHNETVFQHLIHTLRYARNYPPLLQLAVLLHDIGKPGTCATAKDEFGKPKVTFHNHEVIGAGIAFHICQRWKLHPRDTQYVVKMVRHHMFRFEDDSTDKAIRKWLFKVDEDWPDLFQLRIADRKGNIAKQNRPEITYAMKKLEERIRYLIETVPVIFKKDVALTEERIRKLIGPKTDIDEVYSAIIGIINGEPDRNNKKWLTDHIRKVFG